MDMSLQLTLLGTPQVFVNQQPLSERVSKKARALLFYLALTGRAQARDSLMLLFWPEMNDSQARNNLRAVLPELNKALGDHLSITTETVKLETTSHCWVDVHAFERALAGLSAPKQTSLAAPEALQQALQLYQGEFLQGFHIRNAAPFEDWLTGERERLRLRLIDGLTVFSEQCIASGEYASGINAARRLLTVEPWLEQGHLQLMRLLVYNGQRAEALQQYERCKKVMREEFDVAPSEAINAFYQQIRSADFAAPPTPQPVPRHSPPATPPTAFPVRPKHNLTYPLTSFIGRQSELNELRNLLAQADVRLLSLVGAGGVGKTRLATAVGWLLQGAENVHTPSVMADSAKEGTDNRTPSPFPDGIWFVSLENVSAENVSAENVSADADDTVVHQIARHVAGSLSLPLDGSRPAIDQLVESLRTRRLLLILDNFEHLLAGTGFVLALLQQTPGVKLLVTSRRALSLQAEWFYAVEGLSVPTPEEAAGMPVDTLVDTLGHFTAIALFVARAKRTNHRFQLNQENQADVLSICRFVSGNALAIELAAGLTKFYSCAEIHARLKHDYAILTTTQQDVPLRHRLIKGVLDTSWGLLSQREQHILAACAIIHNAFSAEAALAICEASLADLHRLVDQSFLNAVTDKSFDLHPLVRHYLLEQLQQLPAVEDHYRQRHAAHYAQHFAFDIDTILGSAAIFRRIQSEADNVKSAFRWAVAQLHLPIMLTLAETLAVLYNLRGPYPEAVALSDWCIQQLRTLIAQQPTTAAIGLLAQVLTFRCDFLLRLGQQERAEASLNEAVALAQSINDIRTLSMTFHYQGWFGRLFSGDPQDSEQKFLSSLVYGQQAAFATYQLFNYIQLALLYLAEGKIEQAIRMNDQAHNLLNAHHLELLEGTVLVTLGEIAAAAGKWTLLEEVALRIVELGPDRQSSYNLTYAYRHLAHYSEVVGEYGRVIEWAEQILKQGLQLVEQWLTLDAWLLLGRAATRLDDWGRGQAALQQALHLAQELKHPPAWAKTQVELGHCALCQKDWLQASHHFSALLAAENATQNPHLVAAHAGLAWVKVHVGRQQEAAQHLETSLSLLADSPLEKHDNVILALLHCQQVLSHPHFSSPASVQPLAPRLAALLVRASDWLHSRAALFNDEAQRQKFLNQVPEHRQLLALNKHNG